MHYRSKTRVTKATMAKQKQVLNKSQAGATMIPARQAAATSQQTPPAPPRQKGSCEAVQTAASTASKSGRLPSCYCSERVSSVAAQPFFPGEPRWLHEQDSDADQKSDLDCLQRSRSPSISVILRHFGPGKACIVPGVQLANLGSLLCSLGGLSVFGLFVCLSPSLR